MKKETTEQQRETHKNDGKTQKEQTIDKEERQHSNRKTQTNIKQHAERQNKTGRHDRQKDRQTNR